jgi:hypothetical protein
LPWRILDTYSTIDPTEGTRWDQLLENSDQASFFHTSAWPRVVRDSYGHTPIYVVEAGSSGITALLPIIQVTSPVTGSRGVSLPFADFTSVIAPPGQGDRLFEQAVKCGRERGWRYLELRTSDLAVSRSEASVKFFGHVVSLREESEVLFNGMASAVRRAIRKAEKTGVKIKFKTDVEAVLEFYKLHCGTRRRHGVPPQPLVFFENICRHILQKGLGFVATATLQARPIASAIFFHYRRSALYKFGASDHAFQGMRGNNLLMWRAFERCKELGCESVHLGRTSLNQDGLRQFKRGFGAREERICYYRYDLRRNKFVCGSDRANSRVTGLLRLLPMPLFLWTGRLLYPHLS